MTSLHPGVQLLLISGLFIFWLIPLSSWLMLSGQRDRHAALWFAGTGLYALTATLFVFGRTLPAFFSGPLTNALSFASVLFMVESMRREVSDAPTPRLLYATTAACFLACMSIFQSWGHYATVGRVTASVLLAVVEIVLVLLINRVRRLHQSRALWVVMAMFMVYVLMNLTRVAEFLLYQRYSLLLDFTPVANASLVISYLSVIFYCYGYWGFVVEKSRRNLVRATEQAVLARERENLALQREEMARENLRERTSMMERLALIGKHAQSGALSASIAHEINQPLAAIQLNVEMARRRVQSASGDDSLVPLLQRIADDNQRAASIVRNVRALFSQQQPALKNQVLDDLVRFVAEVMRKRLDHAGVELSLDLHTPTPFAFAAGEMEHVLMNLLDNAIDALQPVAPPRCVNIRTWQEPAAVVLCIHDNGPGVPVAQRERIFELSQTSKKHGMGVGLWLARYIVARHGGAMELDAQCETGARFVLRLPLRSETLVSVVPVH